MEEKKRKKRREGVGEKSGGSECGERWRNGGRVNCVYSKNQYSLVFFLFTAGTYASSTRCHIRMFFNV